VQRVRVLTESEVERLLEGEALMKALSDGFVALSDGEVIAPHRVQLALGKGYSLAMPAYRANGEIFVVKIVNVFDGNEALGKPSHQALVCVFDAESGSCIAIVDGTAITTRRTAAAAALSARLLARPGARRLTIVGAGVQGSAHLELLPLACDIEEIRIASLRFEDAERLARRDPRARAMTSVADAVVSGDIVALCTHSGEPVISADWVLPGTHVSSVGYCEPRGELPRELLHGASLFVETRLAFQPTPVGCFELQGLDPSNATELGEVISGASPGRSSETEITVYKAMGHGIEDYVATELALRSAGDALTLDL
jgi:ornithine cyclodeaminase/alanine dehydrogenase-like protein (mu-crystallin family)